jgi:Uri superfamily endonuclease
MKKSSQESGAYILHITLEAPVHLAGMAHFTGFLPPGSYAYAGSARGPGGLAARLGRHLKRDKTIRWHVDRLTVQAARLVPLIVPGGDECRLMAALLCLPGVCVPLPGFGSSDCRSCPAHLARLPASLTPQRLVEKLVEKLAKRLASGVRLGLPPADP